MPLIAIDCRFASGASGLGRYTREVVGALLKRDDGFRYLLIVAPGSEEWIASLYRCEGLRIRRCDARHYSWGEHLQIPRILRQEKVDLLFVPHFNAPLLSTVPFVMTIHDLILHRYPNAAPAWKRAAYRFLMSRAVKRSCAIIAVSEFVQNEITAMYGADASERTTVVTEGISSAFHRRAENEQERARRAYGIDSPFFLYVGNAKEHKNVPMLLEAFAMLPPDAPSLVLVTAGREAASLVLPPRAKIVGHVADEDLPALYSAARAFVTPSLYEGFCLPLAEALSCGCPAIAVDQGPLREVSRGKAMLVRPDVDSLRKAMLSPPPPPAEYARPSWEAAAEKTAAALRRSLSDS